MDEFMKNGHGGEGFVKNGDAVDKNTANVLHFVNIKYEAKK